MYNNFLRQLFSGKCQLTSLRFNIPYNYSSIDIQCLSLFSDFCSHSMFNTAQYCCMTLRYLHIHLNLTCFLEQLIERVPNLERLSVYLPVLWDKDSPSGPPIKRFVQSNEAWSNKVKKLKYLIVKCMIYYDFQLYYLKWILDNLSHVRKVKLRLEIDGTGKKDPVINESLVDANFVRSYDGRTDQNKKRARLLAHLLSMPLQLNYLRIQQFQWLMHVVRYTSDELLKNALKNVRYAEFCLTSCHFGSNQSIGIGNFLVLVLSNYMPHLQTLRLWRPDDFPWTTIRPNFKREHYGNLTRRWLKSLRTRESINKHVTVFEQDLSQLVTELKQFVFLDIYSDTDSEKVEPYRSMVQKRFPNSQLCIDKLRFRLWI
ncbi:unnamed protein product [Rotaria sordida]|uniref:Uncharacterized protein n=2 Tax=Rotaria sordida TaxID=392033 RepID=A0A815FP70_9BILA|nr:unnamed protein product [Rotaria sordida]